MLNSVKELRKELQQLIKPMRMEKPYKHVTHIVRFSLERSEVEFVVCFEEQIEMVFEFLMKQEGIETITVTELGNTVMSYYKRD